MRTFVFLRGQFQSPAAFPRLVQDFSGLRLLVVQDFSGLPLRVVVFFMNLLHGKSRLEAVLHQLVDQARVLSRTAPGRHIHNALPFSGVIVALDVTFVRAHKLPNCPEGSAFGSFLRGAIRCRAGARWA